MESKKIILFLAAGMLTLHPVASTTQDELNQIYFNGNSSKTVIYRTFNKRNIKFIMYNRSRPNGFRIFEDYQNLRKSGFDNSKPTKFLIHGYLGSYKSTSIQAPKNAYMATGHYNIVAVDWSAYSFPYAVAVNSAWNIGKTVGDMMEFMGRSEGLEPSNIHVIGHSLGAHIAGYSGKSIKIRSKRRHKGKSGGSKHKLARITGLDPAAPAFTQSSPNDRLDYRDAHYVDVIHTSTRLLGLAKAIGHADFYPGGGRNQPRCPDNVLEQATGLCDHGESYIYFAQSIKNRHLFPSVSCSNVKEAMIGRCSGSTRSFMGESANKGPDGIYYVSVKHMKKYRNLHNGTIVHGYDEIENYKPGR